MKAMAVVLGVAACSALSLPAAAQDDRTQRILDRIEKEFKESRTRLREEIRAIIREEIQRGQAPAPAPKPPVVTPPPTPPPPPVKPPQAAPAKKVFLGIVATDLFDDERKSLGITDGIKIAEVRGPAAKAGIRAGDILISLGGKPISEETIGARLDGYKPGDTAEAVVARGREKVKLTITFEERKD